MSENEAEIIAMQYEKWDKKHAKRAFIERMEHKMFKRDRLSNNRSQ